MRKIDFAELSVFIIICTICLILMFYFAGIFFFNQQTNDINLQLRLRLTDLMGTLINQSIVIVAAIIYAKYKVNEHKQERQDKKEDDERDKIENAMP